MYTSTVFLYSYIDVYSTLIELSYTNKNNHNQERISVQLTKYVHQNMCASKHSNYTSTTCVVFQTQGTKQKYPLILLLIFNATRVINSTTACICIHNLAILNVFSVSGTQITWSGTQWTRQGRSECWHLLWTQGVEWSSRWAGLGWLLGIEAAVYSCCCSGTRIHHQQLCGMCIHVYWI